VVLKARYNHDGSLIVVSGIDSTVKVLNAKTGEHVATLIHSGFVPWADFSPVDNRIVTGGLKGTTIWDLQPISSVNDAVAGLTNQHRMNAYPNPARDEVVVSFDLAKSDHARLVLVDALGEEVAVFSDQEYSSGTNMTRFGLRVVAAGAYRLVLQTATGTHSVPVMVTH
jgi:hypothetical protein